MKNTEFRHILMSHPSLSLDTREHQPMSNRSISRFAIASIFVIWFTAVFVLGAADEFVRSPGQFPFPILASVSLPLIIFLCLFLAAPAFSRWRLGD